jgi:hypothetical protein
VVLVVNELVFTMRVLGGVLDEEEEVGVVGGARLGKLLPLLLLLLQILLRLPNW